MNIYESIFFSLTMRLINIPESRYVLNFREGDISFPEFLRDTQLSLMVGAGDLCHGGIPNVQKFPHNVFFCDAWDDNGSFQENVNYLEIHKNKVVCLVDYNNKEQMNKFMEVFSSRFYLIDGHGGHTPHFTVHQHSKLLADYGESVNIYERSENIIKEKDIIAYLTNDPLANPLSNPHANPLVYSFFTSRIHILGEGEIIRRLIIEKIESQISTSEHIVLDADIQLSALNIPDLQDIMVSFMYEKEMSLNMKGVIKMTQRVWKLFPALELVLKKVPIHYMDSMIAGSPAKVRAEMIVLKIKEDLDRGFVFGAHAKYKTLRQLLSNKI
jgi:hypothetical protein